MNYKAFKVMVRVTGKLMPMAQISGDDEVEWLDHTFGNDAVRKALDNWRQNRRQQNCKQIVSPKKEYLLRSSGMMNSKPCMPLQTKIQSIRDHNRWLDFVLELEGQVFDILFLTETWRSATEEALLSPLEDYIYFSGGCNHQGIGLCCQIFS